MSDYDTTGLDTTESDLLDAFGFAPATAVDLGDSGVRTEDPGEREFRFLTDRDTAHGLAPRFSDHALVGRQCVYADSQIYSADQSDNFRREINALWRVGTRGTNTNRLTFNVAQFRKWPSSTEGTEETADYVYIESNISEKIKKVQFGPKETVKMNNSFYDKRSFPARVIGREEYFKTDEHWRSYVVGDLYNGIEYSGLIPQGEIGDHFHSAVSPMSEALLDKYNLESTKIKYFVDFNMSYNVYDPKYENKSSPINEFALPNFYALLASSVVDFEKTTASDFRGTVSFETITLPDGTTETVTGAPVYAGSDEDMTYPFYLYQNHPWYRHASLNNDLHAAQGKLAQLFKKDSSRDGATIRRFPKEQITMLEYYDAYSNAIGEASSKSPEILNNFRNVFFNINTVDEFLNETNDLPIEDNAKLFPANINLRMKMDNAGLLVDILDECKLDSKFLVGLHQGFVDNSEIYKVRKRKFIKSIESPNESLDEDGFPMNFFTHKSMQVNSRALNLFNLWDAGYRNGGISKNLVFMGRSTESVKLATDVNNKYRFENTARHLKFATLLRKFLEDKFDSTNRNYIDILRGVPSYTETVAYRVVKRGGGPAGPNRFSPIIQNFWIMNSSKTSLISFFDTQVKYNKNYRYDVYAYKIVVGTKYSYDNLTVSKRISGEISTGMLDANGEPIEETCLSFFDAETGENKDPLAAFDISSPTTSGRVFDFFIETDEYTGLISEMDPEMGFMAPDAESVEALRAPEYVKLSPDQFVTDVQINYEPSVEIIEMPLVSYRGGIYEDAPAKPAVDIFKIENMERTMAFRLRFDEITSEEKPRVVTEQDELYRRNYIMSHSLPTNADFKYNSLSPIVEVQVYRMERPPLRWSDFDGSLRNSITITPGTSNQIFMDKFETNTKYYYMFRSVNIHGIVGQCSEVFEVEMVMEGDLTYADIKAYEVPTRDQLARRQQQVSKKFRRLMRITPSVPQRLLNSDYLISRYTSATSALPSVILGQGNKSSIWDQQKFKIRLTSIKTGRKIDLNLKFSKNLFEPVPDPDTITADVDLEPILTSGE